MDAPVSDEPRRTIRRRGVAAVTVTAALLFAPVTPAKGSISTAPDVAVKAAFLFNFAKFTEWHELSPGAAINMCVTGDEPVADLLVQTVHAQNIEGHPLEVLRPPDWATWRGCHVLFVAESAVRRVDVGLVAIRKQPVLTVSDGKDFCQSDGIIELFVDGGHMRFAINVDAADRAGLHISSRLLGLAKVVRSGHVP
jgi:uncharacterized protein DUF4154